MGFGENDPPNGTGVVQFPQIPFFDRYRRLRNFRFAEHKKSIGKHKPLGRIDALQRLLAGHSTACLQSQKRIARYEAHSLGKFDRRGQRPKSGI